MQIYQSVFLNLFFIGCKKGPLPLVGYPLCVSELNKITVLSLAVTIKIVVSSQYEALNPVAFMGNKKLISSYKT